MSLLAQGLFALALVTLQEGKADPNAGKSVRDVLVKDDLESLAYAAVRLETETRDFTAALASWTKTEDAATKAGRKELVVKAQLGRARCLKALGKSDEAITILKPIVAADAKNVEAASLLEKLAAPSPQDDELKELVRQLADVALSLTSPQSDDRMKYARDDLIRMSDVAVPHLAGFLRDYRVGVVDGAAQILAKMENQKAYQALAGALRDPGCRYPRLLVDEVELTRPNAAHSFYEAMVERSEPEFRWYGAERLVKGLPELPTAVQVEQMKRLLGDSESNIRFLAAGTGCIPEVASRLVPTVQALVDSTEETTLQLAAAFLDGNRDTLSTDVVQRWSAQLGRCPIASVRIRMLVSEYSSAQKVGARINDVRPRVSVLLRFLADDDPAVFVVGATKMENGDSVPSDSVPAGLRASLVAALNHAVELPGVPLSKRYAVVTRLSYDALTDGELFDLFVRIAVKPPEADADWRGSVREKIARALLDRQGDGDRRDAFGAQWLLKIPDSTGRSLWFAMTRARNTNRRHSSLEAVKTDDVELRTLAYRQLDFGVRADLLPHAAEDLQSSDPALVLAVVKAIGWGERPELVAPLRKLLASGSDPLHVAALRALANVGGKAVADELLAAMKATPKDGSFPYLHQLEQSLGAERLAKELVASAQQHGTSNQICWWLKDGGGLTVSGECVSAFVRQLPEELVGCNVLDLLASHLTPDVLATVVRLGLRSGDAVEVELAARLAGDYHIEAAWPYLLELLDAGVGQAREQAIASLKSLRDYRELRRSFAADDSDARRAAFEKAKAMTASKVAEQRAGAAIALAATGDVAAIPPLLDLLGDGDESVRAAARKALEKLADRTAAQPPDSPKGGAEKGGAEEKGKKQDPR